MASLYDSNDTLITDRVNVVTPGYEAIKVENRLLDGSFHTQTIGTPARVCYAELMVLSEAAKDTIDVAAGINAPLKVTGGTKYYIGTVRGAPSWDRRAPGIYRTSIVLLISEEGTL